MIKQTVGITSVGYYIPTGILTSQEMSKLAKLPESVFTDKIGIKQKPIAGKDEHPSDMGIKAALEAINKAKITASEIDLIVYCAAGDYDYRFWSPAAKIQDAIGAENAFAFEVKNFCNSGNLGIHICRNMLLADNDLSYALVVCSDKLSMLLDYSDVNSLSTFIMADGAAAAILKKGETSNQILSYHAITNGKLADCLKVSSAGTKFPLGGTPINDELNYLKVKDPQELERILSDVYLENYGKVIHKSLQKSGYLITEVDFLLTNQVKKSLSKAILASLNLKDEQTFISLPKYGHLGAVDTIFGLAKTLESKKIKPGNLVVLASSAAGFSWAALTVKY
ncbi:3-oxoacyl-[acyl-carrier-protein] synthase III C-terminal domain-containing protein [Nodularia spumigena]|uniref:3-oxoacyl-[acyl-carrier-protein] synthase III C-terminal domain-containing protein n=1 Tax=Nodularia spumigena TaxID=70799 RepID=UPI00232EA81E|nr:3-oxoacyl-[acyl-carrier-protein] synthase III C-terminal domain-containing protein [Nodularia spumigena]MDB9320235.1 3-oxoacyl-[acyl-carrier-protein] synthase III C-terminal domain-containing protein [Nodularia spumigena CS-590/01A]MDB9324889.1 3-oxoacyl-[acyl-carrier-protein] synthase III C-terminal domain-containing protein [Nodularia spumigena CS-590/02]MDB9333848.1 3-oxoacyl-[acyl-carrier-protein] synthase III C-terminal domain-containing protein [Nodularia spumigena CS-590/01]